MQYVVIENFNENISLVLNEEGETFVTANLNEANAIAEECQNGMVIKLEYFN